MGVVKIFTDEEKFDWFVRVAQEDKIALNNKFYLIVYPNAVKLGMGLIQIKVFENDTDKCIEVRECFSEQLKDQLIQQLDLKYNPGGSKLCI